MSFGEFIAGLSNTSTFAETLAGRVGSLFDSDIETTDVERDAQSTGNNDRSRLYDQNKALSNGFSGEFAPEVVPPLMEDFTDMSHSRIMEFVNSIGLEDLHTSVEGWHKLAEDTTTKATDFHKNIEKEMERGWAGSAATQALASTKAYLADVSKVEQAVSLIANKMEEARTGLQQVRFQVPHESDNQSSSKMGILVSVLSPGTGYFIDSASNARAEAAQNAARQVMQTVYRPVTQQSDTQVPKVPELTKPQSDKPIIDDGGRKTGSDGSTNGNNGNNGNNGSNGDGTQPATTTPEDPSTIDPGNEDGGDDTTPSTTTPNTTTPETTDPNATTPASTAPTTPAATTPSGLGTGGGGLGSGGGGGGLGSGGSGTPGAGQSLPGGGQGQPIAASAGTGTGAAGGRAGMAGMGGMGAPGARGGGKDDENEHNAPDYLRGVHEELLGPDRLHVPPVIGGDA
ncbi:hypothetical protein ACFVVM_24165 [Nocardia sp. NPDC058176]|uniref:PPE domain-containing protein n=1 Tax=Nocardia sp. NPDC058176 TaxID=3346368 RepID=UPI0036DD8E86